MEPSKVKERYQALKHQGPTRSLARCDSTDLLPQVIPQYVFSPKYISQVHQIDNTNLMILEIKSIYIVIYV